MDKAESDAHARTAEKVAAAVGAAVVGMLSNSLQTAFFMPGGTSFDGVSPVSFSMFCTTLTALWLLAAACAVACRPSLARWTPWAFVVPTGAGIVLLFAAMAQPVLILPAAAVLSCGIACGFLFWLVITARFDVGEALAVLVGFRVLSAMGALALKPLGHSPAWLAAVALLYGIATVLTIALLRHGADTGFQGPFDAAAFKVGPVFKRLWEPVLFVSILGFASGTMRAFFQPDQALPSSLILFFSTVAGVLAFHVVHAKTRGEAGMLRVRLGTLLGITALYLLIPFIDQRFWIVCSGIVDLCYVAATMGMNLTAVRESAATPARAIVVLGTFKGCVFLSIALGFIANNVLGAIVQQDSILSFILSLMGVYVILLATVLVIFRRLKVALATGRPTVLVNLSEGQMRDSSALQKTYGISEREMDVLVLAVASYSITGIGKQLHISDNTVKTYLKRIYSKLDIHSRDELRTLVTEVAEREARGK